MSDPWDDEDRAIARALDAAPDAETAGADENAVDAYREVLGELPIPERTPRPELEERIVAAALERRPASIPTIAGARARRVRNVRLSALAVATVVRRNEIRSLDPDFPMHTPFTTVAASSTGRPTWWVGCSRRRCSPCRAAPTST